MNLEDIDDTYVIPMWLPPGRHHFFINILDEEGYARSYYSRHVIDIRKDPLIT